jgi:hypothetical protein
MVHNYSFKSIRRHQLVDMVNKGQITKRQGQRIADMRGWTVDFGVDTPESNEEVFDRMVFYGRKYGTIDEDLMSEELNGDYDEE